MIRDIFSRVLPSEPVAPLARDEGRHSGTLWQVALDECARLPVAVLHCLRRGRAVEMQVDGAPVVQHPFSVQMYTIQNVYTYVNFERVLDSKI